MTFVMTDKHRLIILLVALLFIVLMFFSLQGKYNKLVDECKDRYNMVSENPQCYGLKPVTQKVWELPKYEGVINGS